MSLSAPLPSWRGLVEPGPRVVAGVPVVVRADPVDDLVVVVAAGYRDRRATAVRLAGALASWWASGALAGVACRIEVGGLVVDVPDVATSDSAMWLPGNLRIWG